MNGDFIFSIYDWKILLMKRILLNFVHFIKNFKHVGAVAPSSASLVREMVKPLKKRVKGSETPIRILELGPGTGPVTREIVELMRPQDHFDIVELDQKFYKHIKDEFAGANIHVFGMNVMDFQSDQTYDFLISSIPYDQLPQELSTELWQKQMDLLRPNSFLTYFKYYKFNFIRGQFERAVVKKHCLHKSFVMMNVPPALVYTLKF